MKGFILGLVLGVIISLYGAYNGFTESAIGFLVECAKTGESNMMDTEIYCSIKNKEEG